MEDQCKSDAGRKEPALAAALAILKCISTWSLEASVLSFNCSQGETLQLILDLPTSQ